MCLLLLSLKRKEELELRLCLRKQASLDLSLALYAVSLLLKNCTLAVCLFVPIESIYNLARVPAFGSLDNNVALRIAFHANDVRDEWM